MLNNQASYHVKYLGEGQSHSNDYRSGGIPHWPHWLLVPPHDVVEKPLFVGKVSLSLLWAQGLLIAELGQRLVIDSRVVMLNGWLVILDGRGTAGRRLQGSRGGGGGGGGWPFDPFLHLDHVHHLDNLLLFACCNKTQDALKETSHTLADSRTLEKCPYTFVYTFTIHIVFNTGCTCV